MKISICGSKSTLQLAMLKTRAGDLKEECGAMVLAIAVRKDRSPCALTHDASQPYKPRGKAFPLTKAALSSNVCGSLAIFLTTSVPFFMRLVKVDPHVRLEVLRWVPKSRVSRITLMVAFIVLQLYCLSQALVGEEVENRKHLSTATLAPMSIRYSRVRS